MTEHKSILNPDEWDEEMVEAAQHVFDCLEIAKTINRKVFHLHEDVGAKNIYETFDRLQEQLRIPVIVQRETLS